MSWKIEVRVGSDPKWYGNAVRLETESEADLYSLDLYGRWMSVVDRRVLESDDSVNYKFEDRQLKKT
jgi:hypothetical protein